MGNSFDSFAALRYKEFRFYLAMRFFFTFANQIQIVVIGFFVYKLTHSAFSLGMLGLCEAIPAVGLSLYGGYVADKSEKKKMLLFLSTAVTFSSMILYIVTLDSMRAYVPTDWILPVVYSMIVCNGIVRAFYTPTVFSVYANSIPKELYPNGSTWSSSTWQIASIAGPALGGLIYGFSNDLIGVNGISASLGLVVAMFAVSFVFAGFIKRYPSVIEVKENIWKSISAGLHFVFHNKLMLGAISLDLFSVFFGGAVALLPVFADEILHVGAEGLGVMRAMISVGAVVTMLVMARFSPMGQPWRNLLLAVVGFGLSIICFGLSTNFYLSLVFLFLYGAFDSVSVVIRGTIMQLLVPSEMRGRVSAVNSMFISSSNEIGDFESGTVASMIGAVPAVVVGGCVTLLIVMLTFFKTKRFIPLTLQEINEQKPLEEKK